MGNRENQRYMVWSGWLVGLLASGWREIWLQKINYVVTTILVYASGHGASGSVSLYLAS